MQSSSFSGNCSSSFDAGANRIFLPPPRSYFSVIPRFARAAATQTSRMLAGSGLDSSTVPNPFNVAQEREECDPGSCHGNRKVGSRQGAILPKGQLAPAKTHLSLGNCAASSEGSGDHPGALQTSLHHG